MKRRRQRSPAQIAEDDLLESPYFFRERDLIVRRFSDGEVPYAVFEGVVPTRRQMAKIVKKGYGIHLLAVPTRELSFLKDAPGLTHLSVTDAGLDTRAIRTLHNLERLTLFMGDPQQTDLANLPRLREFAGSLEGFESVFRAPALRRAELYGVNQKTLPPVPPQLETLWLFGARSVTTLALAGSEPRAALRDLGVEGSRFFDADCLSAFPNLESISFDKVTRLSGMGTVSQLPLKGLGIVNCRAVEGLAELTRLEGADVTIYGKLTEGLEKLAATANPPWELHGRV